ncbi:MAG: hypothetical protein EXS35_05360 [Pedosphaera sp.]|nr:hypothetical protein [Pedosphaera sp.]
MKIRQILWSAREVPSVRQRIPTSTAARLLCGLLCAALAGGQALARAAKDEPEPEYGADVNAVWPDAQKKGLWKPKAAGKTPATRAPVTSPPPRTTPATPAPAPTAPTFNATPPSSAPGTGSPVLSAPSPRLQVPKATKNEVSASGDLFMGQGTISLPFGYSIGAAFNNSSFQQAAQADRSSLYFGGTVSYSYGQAWYFDVSYAKGSSSGNPTIIGLPSQFTLDDTWFQGYIRYSFPRLRGRRLSAYLRVGGSFVQSDMKWTTTLPFLGLYVQDNQAQDILGNIGFGVRYTLHASRKWSVALQGEGEGFYGFRNQDSTEDLPQDPGYTKTPVSIDNTLMGGIGRGTVRFEYRVGSSGLFRMYADIGFQAKFSIVDYPGAGSQNELLWGPYAKLGVRYSF